MHPFYFADGTTVAPAKLRDDGEQNYLSPEVRAFGLSILGLDWSLCLGNCPWVYCFRKHRVLAVSQPVFLYQLSLGVATFVAPIFTLSWDESFGWSEQQLSAGCTSSPWLIALGHTTVYMALFTKLWRINKVLQVRRTKVELKHVMWPFCTMVIALVVILSIWTEVSGSEWYRETLDQDSGETDGQPLYVWH